MQWFHLYQAINNHKNWRCVLEFIASHNIKYWKCETYFALFSRCKTPHSQDFSDSSEQVCSLERILMENLTPQYKLSQVSILHSEFHFFITPTWQVFARQESCNNGSLHLKHPWDPCNQYAVWFLMKCNVSKFIISESLKDRVQQPTVLWAWYQWSQLDLIQPSSYFYLLLSTQKFAVVLHFCSTNSTFSCFLNILCSFFG